MAQIRSESAPRASRPFKVGWLLWAVCSVAAVAALATTAVDAQGDRSLFLPGETSHGHYQIELSCGQCHSENFDDGSSLQRSCERCHDADLRAGDDSHPKSKFTDPRNAALLEKLDARRCAACHQEHAPEATKAAGVTLPNDFCFLCHQDVGEERATHQGLAFDTCATGGCHNFHDNKALYEDFLVAHLEEPAHLVPATRVLPDVGSVPTNAHVVSSPDDVSASHEIAQAWSKSAHAREAVNCSGCHTSPEQSTLNLTLDTCRRCHEAEYKGWTSGKHGMRIAAGLTPMVVGEARSPMVPAVAHETLTCNSCHGAHDYNLRVAATDACIGCHADEHSRNFEKSKHYALWQAEVEGRAAVGTGVSCATCHMPRTKSDHGTTVEHNQNANLRPNEKMIRSVCANCHGVPFAIDALADPQLVRTNFVGLPSRHVESTDYVRSRLH